MTACPKPKETPREQPAVIVYRDGREVCNRLTAAGRAEYHRRIALMWERQQRTCCLCYGRLAFAEATFEHELGRGHGGGHRDDRVTLPDGSWINGAAHGKCNLEKSSRRETYNQ